MHHGGGVGLYTADTDNREDIKTLNESWNKFQCIIYTSCITTGADYTGVVERVYSFGASRGGCSRVGA